MAKAKLAVESERADTTIMLDPNDVIVMDAYRVRAFAPSDAAVTERAKSILDEGQIHEITIRPNAEDKPVLVAGETTLLAMRKLNSDGAGLKVRARVVRLNDSQAFDLALTENTKRNEMTDIDCAYAIDLKLKAGFKPDQIAPLFGHSGTSWVTETHRLLTLPKKYQTMLHNGVINREVAVILLNAKPSDGRSLDETREFIINRGREIEQGYQKLSEEIAVVEAEPTPTAASAGDKTTVKVAKQKKGKTAKAKAASKAKARKGQISVRAARKAAREAGAHKTKTGKSKALKMEETKDYMASCTGPGEPWGKRTFAQAYLDWTSGKMKEKAFDSVMATVFRAEEPAKTAAA